MNSLITTFKQFGNNLEIVANKDFL